MNRIYLTYEELKHDEGNLVGVSYQRIYLTYEELKRGRCK